MIIYNETIIMDEAIYDEWLAWMKTVHIPAVMQTGHFDDYRLLQILDSPNEGVTVCIQYSTEHLDHYKRFTTTSQQQLQEAHRKQFENQFVQFSTIMQSI